MGRSDKTRSDNAMVIFDLDGTLTVAVLDFDAIRAEIGLGQVSILEAVERMDPPQRQRATGILNRHEEQAARQSRLRPDAKQTLARVADMGFRIAILTRNARRWTRLILDTHGIEVDAVYTRDDGVNKPSPEPVLRLCRRFACDPRQSWMVGDYLFDIQCGHRAGCSTVLLAEPAAPPPYASQANHVIASLADLPPLLAAASQRRT